MNAPTPDRPDLGTIENTETGAVWITWDDRRQPPWPAIASAVSRLSGGAVLMRQRTDDEEGEDRACVVVERGVPQLRPAPEPAKKAVYCSGDLAVVGQDYSQPGHPRKVHRDGTLCDHSGGVRIGDANAAPKRPHWLVTDFDGYWEAQGYQHTGVEFDRDDLSDAFEAGAQAARDLSATAPARFDVADAVIRDVLESLCRRDGLPLESAAAPGEPARNYELADRLGVGHVFGLQPQSATDVEPEPGCPDPGTHVTVRDFLTGRELSRQETAHGAAPAEPQPAPEPTAEPELTEHVSIRFPADMIAAAKHLATAEGMTVSAWIRREVEREAGRREPQPEPGTALYLSAIALLSAGLRDVQHACERGDAPGSVERVAAAALADVDRLRLPRSAPGFRMILGPCPVHAGMAHAQIGDDDEWFCLRALADTAEAVGHGSPSAEIVVPPAVLAPQLGPAVGVVPEDGMLALRPLLSATVAVAADGAIDDDRKAYMLAAFAQDGLRAVFVENATAIGELPPDLALRADIAALAAALNREAEVSGPQVAAAARSIAGRITTMLGEENAGA